jgi:lipopolysaccharide transport system ATP-binding protein
LAKVRGKEDPFAKVGTINDRAQKSGTNEYVKALSNINFEVKKGEVLGIIGKNGAGKSTLLKVISQITAPTTGSIKAKGRIASLLEVGTGMHPEMTGKENVYLNGTILGMTRREIDKKFDEIMDFAGCAKYADTPVKRYSSGMKVRLGFAVAAFLEPEILIVDEVLAVGDAEFQKKAIGKMQDISSGEGRTVLFVSHNMASVKALCHSAVVLKSGLLEHKGLVQMIIDQYLNDMALDSNLRVVKEHPGLIITERNVKVTQRQYVEFTIGLEVRKNFKYLDISIHIFDHHQSLIAILSTINQEVKFKLGFNKIMFKCDVSVLKPGEYSAAYRAIENRLNVAISRIDNCFSFLIPKLDHSRITDDQAAIQLDYEFELIH